MKDNFMDNPNTDENREERVNQKKKGKAGKLVLTVLGFAVVAVAVFLGTVKLIQPDFELSSIPKRVVQLAETTTTTTEPSTTEVTTTEPTTVTETTTEPLPDMESAEYLPIEEFKFENGKKGNEMGNILSGGRVGTDSTYIYHIVDGRGIYRFEPNEERYKRVYKSKNKLRSINLRGDFVYFIDREGDILYRLVKSSGKTEKLYEGAKTAYVYDNKIYIITTDNSVKYMKTGKTEPVELYSSTDEVELVGISLNAVFFTVKDANGKVQYITVDLKQEEGERYFRLPTEGDELVAPVMEDGFLYYYEKQDDLSYNLCRQKYGSKKTVTLVKAVTSLNPVIVTKNRLFYGELDNESFKMKELNMNNDSVKTMLAVKKVTNENTLICQHGGEYDFIMGKKNADGEKVYCASSVLTGSANVMRFKDGEWSYK